MTQKKGNLKYITYIYRNLHDNFFKSAEKFVIINCLKLHFKIPYLFGYKTAFFPYILISLMKFCYEIGFFPSGKNNPKNLDPCFRDLDFWDCFDEKTPCLIPEEIWKEKKYKNMTGILCKGTLSHA